MPRDNLTSSHGGKKPQGNATHPLEYLKLTKLKIPRIGQAVEQLELAYSIDLYLCFGKCLAVFVHVYSITQNSTVRYKPHRHVYIMFTKIHVQNCS